MERIWNAISMLHVKSRLTTSSTNCTNPSPHPLSFSLLFPLLFLSLPVLSWLGSPTFRTAFAPWLYFALSTLLSVNSPNACFPNSFLQIRRMCSTICTFVCMHRFQLYILQNLSAEFYKLAVFGCLLMKISFSLFSLSSTLPEDSQINALRHKATRIAAPFNLWGRCEGPGRQVWHLGTCLVRPKMGRWIIHCQRSAVHPK